MESNDARNNSTQNENLGDEMSNHMKPDEIHEIIRLYRDGWGASKIAEHMCRSTYTIEKLLAGKTHTETTGGKISQGRRPSHMLARYREAAK